MNESQATSEFMNTNNGNTDYMQQMQMQSNQVPPLMGINPMNMCLPSMNGQGFVMPPFFPPEQYGMMMSQFPAGSMLPGNWGAPPPPPPPPPPSNGPSAGSAYDNFNYAQRGSGESNLESDSRKRAGRKGGSVGLEPFSARSGAGGLGSGGGLGSDGAGEARARGGRDRTRRRGRGRDNDDYNSESSGFGGLGSADADYAGSGGLGGGPGLDLGYGHASGGLEVPHGSLLPRMLPQNGGEFIGPQANFTAFGSYGQKTNRRQQNNQNSDTYNEGGYNNGLEYGPQNMGPGRPQGFGMLQNQNGVSNALAGGSMGYNNDRQRNRQRR